MSELRYWRARYVNKREKADQELARRVLFETPQEPTVSKRAISWACMSDFEAYGAKCPSEPEGGCVLWCERWVRRAGVILTARTAVLKARSGV